MINAIPYALYLIVPFISVYLLFRISSNNASRGLQSAPRDATWLSFTHYFPLISFGTLATLAGALGITAGALQQHGKGPSGLMVSADIIMAVIRLQLGLSVVFAFATLISRSIVAPTKVFAYNIICSLIAGCATILDVLSTLLPAHSLPRIVSPVLNLIMTLAPLPLLLILSVSKRNDCNFLRFWLSIVVSQVFAVLHSVFSLFAIQNAAAKTALLTAGAVFMNLWITGIMISLHNLPSCHHAVSGRESVPPHTPKSPTPSYATSGTSDFRNLRDPFASPPPRFSHTEKKKSGYFSHHYHRNLFKQKKCPGHVISSPLSTEGISVPKVAPHSARAIIPFEDVDFDPEEAILSQILLQNLNSAAERRESDASVNVGNPSPSSGVNFGKKQRAAKRDDMVIVTVERRGSESTIGSSTIDSPDSASTVFPLLSRNTMSSIGGTTLYEPDSPLWSSFKWKAKEEPVPEIPTSPTSIDSFYQERWVTSPVSGYDTFYPCTSEGIGVASFPRDSSDHSIFEEDDGGVTPRASRPNSSMC